ncbi:MAG: hypothetical protein ACPGJS_17400 [Flammeovirgaceae bacterium]
MKNGLGKMKPSEHFMILVDSVSPIEAGMNTNDSLVAFSVKRFMATTNENYSIFTQNEIDMQKVFSIVTAAFDSCEDAIEATGLLMENGLEEKNISVIGKYKLLEDLIEEEYEFDEMDDDDAPLSSFDNFGTIELPAVDTVFVAGALMGKHKVNGTIVSLDTTNLLQILKSWGLGHALIQRYFDLIATDKTLVLAVGEPTEISRASSTLKYDTMAKGVDLFAKKQMIAFEYIDLEAEEDIEADLEEDIDVL